MQLPLLASAEDKPPATAFDEALAAITDAKPIIHQVARYEYGKLNALEHSHSATLRTRFGVQSGTYKGFTALVEGVNTFSPFSSEYFDAQAPNPRGQTPVADPERTDVNRYWLKFAKKEWAGLDVKGGRQRIKLDDDRWIGNVGWRQNEQTFDAVRAQSTLGVENLLLQYMYVWDVHRIFANEGAAGQLDFNPNAHFFNVGYKAGKALKAVGFVYLVDPDTPVYAAFGSATYGARFTGAIEVSDNVSIPYQASYAYQTDWGRNQVAYDAHYVYAEAGLKFKSIGTLFFGYEHLGSDTDARIVTPFSTAHKFNGFADVFLNNGGLRGLRDFYVSIAPKLPFKGWKMRLWFHQFWDDQGGDNLGQEYNLVTSYPINKYVSLLWKAAYFDGGKNRSPTASATRSIVQATFKF
ncbi:MAG: alginate export family protein [Myxococcota bacterium]